MSTADSDKVLCDAIRAMVLIVSAVDGGAVRKNDRERLLSATNHIQAMVDAYKEQAARLRKLEANVEACSRRNESDADTIARLRAERDRTFEQGYRAGVDMFADPLPDEDHLAAEIAEAKGKALREEE